MKVSINGLNLIKRFEGCRLKAYKDIVGVWTIGYGTTNADKKITGITISEGTTITQSQADEWLEMSVNNKYGKNVNKFDSIYHWNQNEFDALTSFAYNIGSINGLVDNGRRSRQEIADKMILYNKAGGKVLEGLAMRRRAEQELFMKPYVTDSSGAKTVEQLAKEVIVGKWGSGNERRRRLEQAGYDYAKVQNMVNKLLGGEK